MNQPSSESLESRFGAFYAGVLKRLGADKFPSDDWRDNDLGVRRLGYFLVGFIILVAGGWSACAPIESAAIAPGVVQVEGKRKPVQHLEGGIVASILTQAGERVEVDQPLIELDAASDRAEREIIQGRLFNMRATVDRLKAERDDLKEVVFSSALSEVSESDSRAREAILSEKALFEARLADRRGEEAVLQSRMEGQKAVLSSKRLIKQSLAEEIDDLRSLLAEGYVDKQRLFQLERQNTQLLGEVSDLEVAIDETALRILQVRKRFKTEVVDALTQAREQLYDLEQQFLAVDDRVARATIRAPVAGIVMNIGPNSVGAVIGSGETLMEIVPYENSLVIEARISPMDIDRVRIGQSAEVRFAVFKDSYSVSGALTQLSADRLIDQESQTAYYAADIKMSEDDYYLLEGMTLIPGMPAEVVVKTGQRTFLGYITSPMNRLFSRSLLED